MEVMKSTLDKKVYAFLLGEVQPKVIESEEENEFFLAEVEKLMGLGED
jgi:HTH-type transcriptional regulator/antitoxin HigA